jgi:hypothetical protein
MRRNGSVMMAMPLAIGAVALVMVVALATSPRAENPRDTTVSLIQLIATPTTFDGKRISLVGYVVLEADHNAVYLSESDARYGIARNALWLDVPAVGEDDRVRLHEKYVLIEGRFNARRRGHRELFGGTIEQIGRFEPVEPRPGPLTPAPH